MSATLDTMSNPALEVTSVSRRFGDVTAVDGVSFTVNRGQVVGLLGPNGAGKTTLVKLLTTLLPMDGGSARVAGYDVATEPAAVRERIGLAGQAAAVDEVLTARENLELFGRLYHLPRTVRAPRAAALIDQFEMTDFADRPASTYSGGQRRRLDVAVALIAEPQVLFLDEPTVGLDTRSRREVWRAVEALASAGTAIVLTTQYLEEADALADRIIVIDRGRPVAEGTPDQLKTQIGQDVLEIRVRTADDLDAARAALGAVAEVSTRAGDLTLEVPVHGGAVTSLDLLGTLQGAGIRIDDFQHRRPTLDDVFLTLTAEPSTGSTDNRKGASR